MPGIAQERPADDETVLTSLARDIACQQMLLADLRARERTVSRRITLYLLAAWLVYLGLWYCGLVSGGRVKLVERAVRALPVFVGPIVILFIRRIVQIWYAKKGDAKDKTLQVLLNAQRAKFEDIKKKTNFYETCELLSRYGDSFPGLPSPSSRPGTGNLNAGGEWGGNVSMPNPLQWAGQVRRGGPRLSMLSAAPSPSASAAHRQQQYHRRGWFDLLADLLVGSGDSPQTDKKKPRRALVCAKCASYNGLMPEGGVRECSRFIVFLGFLGKWGCVGARPLRVSRGRRCGAYRPARGLGSSAVGVTARGVAARPQPQAP
ncbi:hypothetical protein K438DRAFT_233984 [Mycena galopus ATCC 62051]|nr:hypothetical protein K438DRAFT_233984 [Mycena galopus ATCC 62051]